MSQMIPLKMNDRERSGEELSRGHSGHAVNNCSGHCGAKCNCKMLDRAHGAINNFYLLCGAAFNVKWPWTLGCVPENRPLSQT